MNTAYAADERAGREFQQRLDPVLERRREERTGVIATTPGNAALVAKLARIMAAVESIPKRGKNTFHNYDYATEADIVATVRQKLAAENVMLFSAVDRIEREAVGEKGQVLTTIRMTFTFIDGESGATLSFPWAGAGTDKEDKGLYKAMTGGEKYFLLKTFLMPTGDDPERDEKQRLARPKPIPAAKEAGLRLKDVAGESGWASEDLKTFLKKRGFTSLSEVGALKPDIFESLIKEIKQGPNVKLFEVNS
jgi:hypothetical protein